MSINPPTGNEKPLRSYGGSYLDDEMELKAELTRAEVEGREPRIDAFDENTIRTVAPHLLNEKPYDPHPHQETEVDEDYKHLIENANTNTNQVFGSLKMVSKVDTDKATEASQEQTEVQSESTTKNAIDEEASDNTTSTSSIQDTLDLLNNIKD